MLSMLPRLMLPIETTIKRGSLVRLRFLKGDTAVILSGKTSLKSSGGLDKIKSHLDAAGINAHSICGVSGDPTIQSVLQIAKEMSSVEPDWIVACGGGAVIDSAKLAWVTYENPSLEITDFASPYTLPELRSKARLVAIPTTAGTGSEASVVAVVTDMESKTRIPIVSEQFLPDLVILDPTLTTNLSPETTVYPAMDALTHAVESYCSTISNHLTSAYCAMAGRMIVDNIPLVLANPDNLEARERLLYAAMFSGIAQNMTSVGASHALSHAIGAHTGLSHGLGNAIFLPLVLRHNADTSQRPLEFTREMGFSSLDQLLKWQATIMESAKLPTSWGQALEPDVTIDLEEIANTACNDVCMKTNPRKMDLKDVLGILECAK